MGELTIIIRWLRFTGSHVHLSKFTYLSSAPMKWRQVCACCVTPMFRCLFRKKKCKMDAYFVVVVNFNWITSSVLFFMIWSNYTSEMRIHFGWLCIVCGAHARLVHRCLIENSEKKKKNKIQIAWKSGHGTKRNGRKTEIRWQISLTELYGTTFTNTN